jgi:uncharacterized membrane protein
MSSNPYAAPKSTVADATVTLGEFVPGGKGVPAARGWNWIADGWALFREAPGLWIGMIIVFFVIYLGLMLVPFVGPAVQYVLMPVFMAGIVAGCRALDEGRRLEFNHLFEGFRTSFGTLAAVGALYLAGFIVILVVVMVLTGASVFGLMMAGGGVGQDPVATGAAALTLVLAILLALALTIPLMMAVWFAPALVLLHGQGAVEAMKGSFTGCLRNILPFLVYGIVGFVLAILATIPLGLGWLVLGPVIAASVYTAYKDIYRA